jgi:hypothetical protein
MLSLRETKKINEKFTMNVSHLTASVDVYGYIRQLKGNRNSHPKEIYYKYIYALLIQDHSIKGFKLGEYKPELDFKLIDFDDKLFESLYKVRPELFRESPEIKRLRSLGLLKTDVPSVIHIGISDIDSFFENGHKHHVLIESIIRGVYEKIWVDWRYFELGDLTRIKFITPETYDLFKVITSKRPVDADMLNDIVDQTVKEVGHIEIYDYLHNQIKDGINRFGGILELDSEGLTLQIDVNDLIDNFQINGSDVDLILIDACRNDVMCFFDHILHHSRLIEIEKPIFKLDKKFFPPINQHTFNKKFQENIRKHF